MEITNAEKTPSQPIHSFLAAMAAMADGADLRKMLPMANSAMSRGIPTVKTATI